ncbi:type II secretion system F family protein [Natronolimnohabitans innermongolicus]|uniref:Type II secretion system F domain-containing protein n=1 Tax=Natronolimnohabitans innermongolicus JCM 12255 TaxID=1227499 RepID=L9XI39_9EURY|nr:type II secretion system F family protein [Natronolimnohabitans innermongolicus]ELY61056.1 type II secretion system F domain-containing protein [Natronolimnohabitans innermongolicus JCM 12255]
MTLANALPLLVAVCCCVPIGLARVHQGVDRRLTRTAIVLFGGYVDEFRDQHPNRRAALRAARVPVTYREYGAKTVLYATLAAILGSVLGIYVVWGLLLVLSIDPETLRDALPSVLSFLANLGGVPALSPTELFALLVASCLTLGALAGGATYWLRWWYPASVADTRARAIAAGLPSTVAFVYALSKSGMAVPEVIRIVAAQRDTYGEAAAEFEVAVREMDTFGVDVVTALQTMGRRSPSPQFREFTENFVSVLRSGHSRSAFLERQYREYQEEAESQQERTLDLLSTLAEAYVTVLVAGPLFLLTVLVVIGISVGDTLEPLRALVYVILPLGNLAFVVYLSVVTEKITPGDSSGGADSSVDGSPFATGAVRRPRADGGATVGTGVTDSDAETAAADPNSSVSANLERLRYYRRLRGLRERFGDPLRTLRDRPALSLLVTVPIALAGVLWQLRGALEGGFDVAAVDDAVAVGLLFVLAVFAVCYESHRRRIEAIEAAIPDFLDRLAGVNEAGTSVVSAIDHVRGSELGPLGAELDRVRADVQLGASLQTALARLESRVRTRSTSRVVTLLTQAMNASGNLGTVLRIAARQAAADRRLERERAQAMVEYLLVVYVSFLVFLFIIAVLAGSLLPNLPAEGADAAGDAAAGTAVDGLGGFSAADRATYDALFYHATLVQGLLSGLIAGQLSSGDVRAGAKHAAAMIALSIVTFAVVI